MLPLRLSTPSIVIVRFELKNIFAPDLFKKFIKSIISGSIAMFLIIVFPLHNVAAIIKFSVAPTDIVSNFNLLGFSFLITFATI